MSQQIRILFVHGWASNAEIWSRCTDRLKQMVHPTKVNCVFVDRGYFGDPVIEVPEDHFDLAVGHSAGLSWLMSQPGASCDKLVSIGGFTRFCSGNDFAAGWHTRIVDRMSRQLVLSSPTVIEDFWEKASTARTGHANPPLPPDKPIAVRLQTDLQALSSVDCRQQWTSFAGPRLVIAATADRIISPEHSQLCFGDQQVEWIQTDSHWIPWTFPETCAALLREMIEMP